MLNRITMTGRLVADPELRRTKAASPSPLSGLPMTGIMARARRKRRTFRCRGLEIHR